jgi:hypothetical protein
MNTERINALAENIRNARNAATPDQIARGAKWYTIANGIAAMVGDGDVRKGAGIIAALSPRMQWDRNVKLALDAGNGHVHGAMGASLRKAQAILDGTAPEEVLPMAAKTGNFYVNVSDPNEPNAVTVDAWAYRVATADPTAPGPKSQRDYDEVAQAYRMIAAEFGELANVTQAGTWNWAREGGMK